MKIFLRSLPGHSTQPRSNLSKTRLICRILTKCDQVRSLSIKVDCRHCVTRRNNGRALGFCESTVQSSQFTGSENLDPLLIFSFTRRCSGVHTTVKKLLRSESGVLLPPLVGPLIIICFAVLVVHCRTTKGPYASSQGTDLYTFIRRLKLAGKSNTCLTRSGDALGREKGYRVMQGRRISVSLDVTEYGEIPRHLGLRGLGKSCWSRM